MSDERDSLWVIAVIAVLAIAVPVLMIGFPASDDVDDGVKITLDCSNVDNSDWNNFAAEMNKMNWSISSGKYLVKYFPGSMPLKDSGKEMGFFTDVGNEIYSSSGGSYVLENDWNIPRGMMTLAQLDESTGPITLNVIPSGT